MMEINYIEMFRLFLILGLVFCFPLVSMAGLAEDPRFWVTTYNYTSSNHSMYSKDVITFQPNEEVLIFSLYGDFEELSIYCDIDVFEDEYIDFSSSYVDSSDIEFIKTFQQGGVLYDFKLNDDSRISLMATVKDLKNSVVTRCDIVDYEFMSDEDYIINEDLSFTLGDSGVFYIDDGQFSESMSEIKEDSIVLYPNVGLSEDISVDEIELSCQYAGGTDPVSNVVINGIQYEPDMVDDATLYGRFYALDGFYGSDYISEEYYEIFLDDIDYLYKFNDLGLEGVDQIEIFFEELDDEAYCNVDRIFIKDNDEEYQRAFSFGEFEPQTKYGEYGLNDVEIKDKRYEGYKFLVDEHVIDGYPDGTFRADKNINRAEVAKMIDEAFFTSYKVEGNCFEDLEDESWYVEHVCKLKDAGIVNGVADSDKYEPARGVNLVEAYKIVFETLFEADDIGSSEVEWYEKYVSFAESKNIYLHKDMELDKPLSRGDFAEMLYGSMLYDYYFDSLNENINTLRDKSEYVVKFLDLNNTEKYFLKLECDVDAYEGLKSVAKLYKEASDYINLSPNEFRLNEYEDDKNMVIAEIARKLDPNKTAYIFEQESQRYRVDFDYKYNLLGIAAFSGCENVIDYYLDQLPENAVNDDAVYDGMNLLDIAVFTKNLDLVKYLVDEKNAEIGGHGVCDEIHYAVNDEFELKGNEIEIISYLIENGADVNLKCGYIDRYTTYSLAATDEIREFLLDNGYELTEFDANYEE